MTELPIVVETSPWLAIGFGVLMLLVAFVLARGTIFEFETEEVSTSILRLLAALFVFGLGISLVVHKLNWQFRLEEKGIVLQAPFDYLHPGAEIGWSEITSVYVSEEAGFRLGTSFKLHIRGKPGTEIIVNTADRLPAQFGMLLQNLVAERAPQAKGIGEIAKDFAYARGHPAFLASGYSVRNGRGELLR